MKTITLCEKCHGHKTVFMPPWDWDPEKDHWQHYKACPACGGTGLTGSIPDNAETFQRQASTILGPDECAVRISPNTRGPGFDLWIAGKKLTRGRKYLRADSLTEAIRQVLLPSEYRGAGTAIFA